MYKGLETPGWWQIGDLCDRYRISEETQRAWERDYGFPLPMQPGRRRFWNVEEVLDWERRQKEKYAAEYTLKLGKERLPKEAKPIPLLIAKLIEDARQENAAEKAEAEQPRADEATAQ